MRPDYSLIISAHHDEPAAFEPIVLHFDAKYRVNLKAELFGLDDEVVDDDPSLPQDDLRREGALRADLLKMHSYRDAIRRSAGAYVIYPGDDDPSSVSSSPNTRNCFQVWGLSFCVPLRMGLQVESARCASFSMTSLSTLRLV